MGDASGRQSVGEALTYVDLPQAAPSAVAALAIIGGYLDVSSSNRNQRRLAREAYQRARRTKTYLDLLKGVHLPNAQLYGLLRAAGRSAIPDAEAQRVRSLGCRGDAVRGPSDGLYAARGRRAVGRIRAPHERVRQTF
jgi:hypothetical protein